MAFLEVPFKIWDCMIEEFISLPPSSLWCYPLLINPFYLVKNGCIKDSECPNLQYYTNILSGETQAYFEDMPCIPPLSSSPPPPGPCVENTEAVVQATEVTNHCKRRHSDSQSKVVGPIAKAQKTTAKVELNIHVHCGGGCRHTKKGTGKSAKDPIVL